MSFSLHKYNYYEIFQKQNKKNTNQLLTSEIKKVFFYIIKKYEIGRKKTKLRESTLCMQKKEKKKLSALTLTHEEHCRSFNFFSKGFSQNFFLFLLLL